MKFPAPDLVVEVLSKTTEELDRGIKLQDYEAHGVSEYWIVDPDLQTLEQYTLKDGNYSLKHKSKDGHLTCEVLAGFEVPVTAFFNDQENLNTLKKLI